MKNRILIIEDEPEILEILTTVLTQNNYRVTGIKQTDDIIGAIKEYEPNLVLTDYLLFGMDGGSICQFIKTNPETNHIPVILITAYKSLADALGSAGFDDFIPKPFNIKALIKTIKAHI